MQSSTARKIFLVQSKKEVPDKDLSRRKSFREFLFLLSMGNEVWHPVKNYEGLYEVSNMLRVKAVERFVNGKNGSKVLLKEVVLKGRINRKGYREFNLSKNGKKNLRNLHRILALTFIPNPLNKREVNHIDGNKLNNNLDNLEWATRKENAQHAFKTGLCVGKRGVKCNWTKLTEKEVLEIRRLKEEKTMSSKDIAIMYNVAESNINGIFARKTWKHI